MRIRLSIPLRLSEIAKAAGAVSFSDSNKDTTIEYISTDTRELCRGDLFIALCGKRYNGEEFLAIAKDIGAYTMATRKGADIRVTSTDIALLTLASHYKRKLPIKHIIAITGSNGKTTTRELTASLFLSAGAKYHSSEENYNNLIGVSYSVLSAPADTEYLIIECGMSAKNELRRISNAINPTVSVITNIGSSHLSELKTRENIASAKLEILAGMSAPRVIIPNNEPLLAGAYGNTTLSVDSYGGDYAVISSRLASGCEYSLMHFSRPLAFVSSALPFCHIKEALGFAFGIYLESGLSKQALQGIELPKRLLHTELYEHSGVKILNDSYNSSLESVEYALKTLSLIQAERRIALLSDTLESADPPRYHKDIGRAVAKNPPDLLLLYGIYAEYIRAGALASGFAADKIKIIAEDYREGEVAFALIKQIMMGDAILIKGSHGTGAYKIAPIVCEHLKTASADS